MVHITCDLCRKAIRAADDRHYVVKVEVFAHLEPVVPTEADLEDDHLEAVDELLEDGLGDAIEGATRQCRFDLCGACRERYLRDPLGRESQPKLDFSKN